MGDKKYDYTALVKAISDARDPYSRDLYAREHCWWDGCDNAVVEQSSCGLHLLEAQFRAKPVAVVSERILFATVERVRHG